MKSIDKMGKMENKFKKYLDEQEESPYQFSKRAGMASNTIHRIYTGQVRRRSYLSTVKKICRFSNGKLTLQDFGYND